MHIVAHRGFSGRYPEMSPIAYEKALQLPIHGVECDVRLTKDGHVVCTHDRTMLRVAGVRAVVSTSTLAQLKRLNIGDDSATGAASLQRILTLDELLDMVFATDDKHIYIEAKHPTRMGRMLEEQLALSLKYHGLAQSDRVHFISFSHAAVRRMNALVPAIETFYLRREWEAKVNPADLHFSHPNNFGISLKRAKLDTWILDRDAQVYAPYMWTVNDPDDMLWADSHDVGVMATDYPDIAVKVLGRAG